jgi:hypothetical protein
MANPVSSLDRCGGRVRLGIPVLVLVGVGWWLGKVGAIGNDDFLDGLAEVVPQVPPVGDLDRVGCCFADGFGVGARPVPAHDLYSGVGLQPRGHGLFGAVGQYVNGPARGDVDEDGGVDVPAPDREVVDEAPAGSTPRAGPDPQTTTLQTAANVLEAYWVLLIDLNRDVLAGDNIDVTFTFAQAPPVTLAVPIRPGPADTSAPTTVAPCVTSIGPPPPT